MVRRRLRLLLVLLLLLLLLLVLLRLLVVLLLLRQRPGKRGVLLCALEAGLVRIMTTAIELLLWLRHCWV